MEREFASSQPPTSSEDEQPAFKAEWERIVTDASPVGGEPMPLSEQSVISPSTFSSSRGGASLKPAFNNSWNGWSIAATIVLVGHAIAVAWFALQWITGLTQLQCLTRQATMPGGNVLGVWSQVAGERGRCARLLVSDQIEAPLGIRLSLRTVLLPISIASGDEDVQRLCLAHEWSHLQNSDLPKWHWTNFCQILLWYQPVYWLLRRELRTCQDLIADDYASSTSNDEFGRISILRVTHGFCQAQRFSKLVGAMAFYSRSSALSRRIKMLLLHQHAVRPRRHAVLCTYLTSDNRSRRSAHQRQAGISFRSRGSGSCHAIQANENE